MPLDEPWRERRAGKIDHPRVRSCNACRRPDGIDSLAEDANRPSLVHGLAVEHARRAKDDRRRVGRRLGLRGREDNGGGCRYKQRNQRSGWHAGGL